MSSKVKDVPGVAGSEMAQTTGVLFVVSSPSGGGKGTLIRRVLELVPDLSYSVSYTTRPARNGEVHGREYFFVDRKTFAEMIEEGAFLEWALVHGNLYGTSKGQIADEICSGIDIILEVDVQGAQSVRQLELDSVSVFILPPSYETLRRRLIARGTDSAEELELRLRNAPDELSHYTSFDYVIVNNQVDEAAGRLAAIICAERVRCARQEKIVANIIEKFKEHKSK
ncbi:MAG: guanylate kinase [Pyrinomonadaceae bacterium]